MKLDIPTVPSIFLLASQSIADPSSTIFIPKSLQGEEIQIDYEVELAFILNKKAKDVKEEDAMSYVAGWTIANDLTSRGCQSLESQWCYSKGKLCKVSWFLLMSC